MDNQHIHNLFQSSLNAQQCVQKMLYQKLCFLNLLLYSCTESLDIQANQTFVKIAGLNLLASNFCTAFPTDISIITKQKFLHNVIKTPFYVTTHNNQAISKRLVDSLLSQVWYTIIEQQSMLTNKTFKAISQDTFEKFPNYIIRGNCTIRGCGVYLFLL